MPRKSDHLQFHGGQWRVVMAIPHDVRPAFGGGRYFLQPLGTANIDEANRLKGAWLTKWRTDIALERQSEDPDLKEARRLRRQFVSGSDKQAEAAFERLAGGTAWTVADVVGHDPEEQPLPMTMGRYPGRAGSEETYPRTGNGNPTIPGSTILGT